MLAATGLLQSAAMATITKVGKRWRAQVRKSGHRSTARTFDTRTEAARWARKVEHDFDGGKALRPSEITVPQMIAVYRKERGESGRPVADKSKEHYQLKGLSKAFDGVRAFDLTQQRMVDFAKARRNAGVSQGTINLELSKIGTVMRYVGSLLNIDLPDAIGRARPLLHHLHLIGPGVQRSRRPTADELSRIFGWFQANPQYGIPMVDVVQVAMQCGLRRGEVFRVLWADLDVEKRVLLVRDRKHPRKKMGNHDLVPLVGNSLDIIMRQRRVDERIFPYRPETASGYFRMACNACGIVDLRLHDMRHEAASALFEAGWGVAEVAVVTGHRDWRNLKRYTNLDPVRIAQKPT